MRKRFTQYALFAILFLSAFLRALGASPSHIPLKLYECGSKGRLPSSVQNAIQAMPDISGHIDVACRLRNDDYILSANVGSVSRMEVGTYKINARKAILPVLQPIAPPTVELLKDKSGVHWLLTDISDLHQGGAYQGYSLISEKNLLGPKYSFPLQQKRLYLGFYNPEDDTPCSYYQQRYKSQGLHIGVNKLGLQIKDFNRDGYRDIGLNIQDVDCATGKHRKYRLIYLATNKGFVKQQRR